MSGKGVFFILLLGGAAASAAYYMDRNRDDEPTIRTGPIPTDEPITLEKGKSYRMRGTFVGNNEAEINRLHEQFVSNPAFSNIVFTHVRYNIYQYDISVSIDEMMNVEIPGVIRLYGIPLNIREIKRLTSE